MMSQGSELYVFSVFVCYPKFEIIMCNFVQIFCSQELTHKEDVVGARSLLICRARSRLSSFSFIPFD